MARLSFASLEWFSLLMRNRMLIRTWSWSLLDQGIVSGANFVCGVLLARTLGLESFGAYVIAQTYLLYANTFQSALVVSPMMTAVPAEASAEQRRLLLRGFFGCMLLVLLLTSSCVQLIAAVLGQWSPILALGELVIPLAAAIIAFQLQDWLRRVEYVSNTHRAVFFNDLVAYGGQLLALGLLATISRLTPALALWVMAGSFAVSGLTSLIRLRLWPSVIGTRSVIATHWRASLDFLATWQLQWAGSSGVILIGSGVIGAQAAGAIRAVSNLLGPVNVAFQWMDNLVPVKSALHFRQGGRVALGSYLTRINRLGMITLGCATLLLLLVDEWLMGALYGAEFLPYASLVVFQALYYLVGNSYRIQSYYNRTLGRTAVLAQASVWWAVVAVISSTLLVKVFEERGIMGALILGEIAGLLHLLLDRRKEVVSSGLAQSSHIDLRAARGAALILPIANRNVLRGVLSMYFPSRWSGRIYRSLLTAILPVWSALGLARSVNFQSTCSHLPWLVRLCPEAKEAWTGALVAGNGRHSKFTLRLMRESGEAVLYARLAYEPAAMQVIAHEAHVLAMLADTPAKMSAPTLVGHGALSDPHAYFLAETAGPDAAAGSRLTRRHFAFLTCLLRPDDDLNFQRACPMMEADWRSLADETGEPVVFLRAPALLRELKAVAMPSCISHGDFAPWNIRRQDDGTLFVIDWEHASLHALPWLDALHFQFQLDAMVRRRPASKVCASLLHVFVLPEAEGYRAATGFTPGIAKPLVTLYLLNSLLTGRTGGRDWHSIDQVARLRCLTHLLEGDAHAG